MIGSSGSRIGSGGCLASHASFGGLIRPFPQVMVRVDDRQLGLEDRLGRRLGQPRLVRRADPAVTGRLARLAHVSASDGPRLDDDRLLLPAGPDYRLMDEVKSIITVVAKTHHYWQAHVADTGRVARDGARG